MRAGEWTVGQPLPSRREMSIEYRVHEQTIRLTYDLLRRSGGGRFAKVDVPEAGRSPRPAWQTGRCQTPRLGFRPWRNRAMN
ncbi:GntR family transcriptional regulator [Streptomyces griseus]|uniref:hypothetical protein n=1 Tax=Streptomyces griseus TaxID=1911 RepID=UPI0036D05096